MRPRLIDLCCGAGGAGTGYERAGFDVFGVDIAPQPHYPFRFHRRDAFDLLEEIIDGWGMGYHAIHASFPCQLFTRYRRRGSRAGDGYEDLITPGRELLERTRLPYVIENVPDSPLKNPVQLCGTGFGLDVQRHRLFESNFPLMGMPCAHGRNAARFPAATNRAKDSRRTVEVGVWRIPLAVQKRAMGVDWDVTLEELSEMIPPAYTEHVGRYLLQAVKAQEAVS